MQGGGKYHVTYTPLVPGDHEVSIQVDGREIPNAPYMCVVKMNYAPQMKANEPLPCLALPCLGCMSAALLPVGAAVAEGCLRADAGFPGPKAGDAAWQHGNRSKGWTRRWS